MGTQSFGQYCLTTSQSTDPGPVRPVLSRDTDSPIDLPAAGGLSCVDSSMKLHVRCALSSRRTGLSAPVFVNLRQWHLHAVYGKPDAGVIAPGNMGVRYCAA